MKFVKHCLLFLLLTSGNAQTAPLPEGNNAGQVTSTYFINNDLAKERKSNTPILFAECLEKRDGFPPRNKVTYSNHVVIFDIGSATGSYLVFSWEQGDKPETAVWNDDADIKFWPPKSPHVVIDNVSQGGPYEYNQFQLNAEFLLHQGLSILYPKDFQSLAFLVPKTQCPDWPAGDRSQIDKIYKERKW